METKNMVVGLVFIAMIFIVFYSAFGLPTRTYIPQENIDQLEELGKRFVQEAEPTFIGQVFFFIGSFWAIVRTTFNLITVGIKALIFDIGGMFGVDPTILAMIVGLIIFVWAYQVLKKLRGG